MTRFIDLLSAPVLGRLRGINRKHRLRSHHYAPIKDWPDAATIEVLDRGALETRDHLPCSDALFVVSDKLRAVLASVVPDAQFFRADAGGRQVWVVAPLDGDVMYESAAGTHAKYSKSGYQVTHAMGLRVEEQPKTAWCRVRNASLVALRADVLEAARNSNVAWDPVESIAEYRPYREHPYAIVSSSHGAYAETLEPLEAWPAAPATVAHPLHAWVRDEEIDKPDVDVDAAWSKLVHKEDDRAALVRYCSGLALPRFRAVLDPDCAKSKLKKRWKDSTTAGSMSCKGMFVVNAAVVDLLGQSCRYTPIEMRCPKLELTHAGFSIVEPPTVDWIDWSRSDVMYQWSTMYDGYAGLHPIEDSYTATQPIVRIAGTSLILIQRSIVDKLDKTFYVKPLHEVSVGLNLDDYERLR